MHSLWVFACTNIRPDRYVCTCQLMDRTAITADNQMRSNILSNGDVVIRATDEILVRARAIMERVKDNLHRLCTGRELDGRWFHGTFGQVRYHFSRLPNWCSWGFLAIRAGPDNKQVIDVKQLDLAASLFFSNCLLSPVYLLDGYRLAGCLNPGGRWVRWHAYRPCRCITPKSQSTLYRPD